jgi:tetrapyrrole methylase family protein/MazG family protein
LDEGDPAKMQEEFGDVLFEVLLQTQVAEDEGEFDLSDMVYGIASKLVRRHPHVFGDEAASTAREVEQRWDALKQAERGAERSALDGVPTVMPALAYSQALLSRAARAGFAWPGLDDVLRKLSEEVAEVESSPSQAEKREEFGDVLINVVNAARYLEIDAEDALRMASHKFRHRFVQVERLAKERGMALSQMNIAEKQALWEEAKGSS